MHFWCHRHPKPGKPTSQHQGRTDAFSDPPTTTTTILRPCLLFPRRQTPNKPHHPIPISLSSLASPYLQPPQHTIHPMTSTRAISEQALPSPFRSRAPFQTLLAIFPRRSDQTPSLFSIQIVRHTVFSLAPACTPTVSLGVNERWTPPPIRKKFPCPRRACGRTGTVFTSPQANTKKKSESKEHGTLSQPSLVTLASQFLRHGSSNTGEGVYAPHLGVCGAPVCVCPFLPFFLCCSTQIKLR